MKFLFAFIPFHVMVNAASPNSEHYQPKELQLVNKIVGCKCIRFGLQNEATNEGKYANDNKDDVADK